MLEIVSVILAPALFWLVYHLRKDRLRPEPLAALLGAYLAGIAAGWLCLRAYGIADSLGLRGEVLDGPLELLLYCLFVVGGLEELAKFLPFLPLCLFLRHFDEPIDGIVYASVVALGFASYENFLYMRFLDGAPMIARAVASPLTHAMFASIWGYACGGAWLAGARLWWAAATGLALAAGLHGIYDFLLLGAPSWVRPLTAGIILAIWMWRMRLIRRLQQQEQSRAIPGNHRSA